MTEPVKRRTYSSSLRQEQAQRTRARILEAAGALFEARGYAATTVAGIAAAAEVATDTVYKTFGTKARIVTALIDDRLAPPPTTAGATPVDNVMDRPEARAVRDEPDPEVQLVRFAHDMAAVSTSVRPMYEILRTAAAVEPEMAAVHAEMDGYRLANMRRAAGWLAADALRLDPDRAAEIMWVLASPDVGRMLCDTLGWSQDEFASWLADALVRLLLVDPEPGRT